MSTDIERAASPKEDDGAAEPEFPWSVPGAPEPRVVAQAIPVEHIDPDAAKVVRRLVRHGHVAYLVGGSVRDLLLGRKPKDFDVATSARPNEVRSLFRNCRVIGRRFRLAHILFSGGKIIEVATFRRDPSADFDEPEIAARLRGLDPDGDGGATLPPPAPGSLVPPDRHAEDLLITHDNVFGDPHEDAIRRDFTINGLFYDVNRGEVIDYVGGLPDLEARVVRTIGHPTVRLREDPIRTLRAVKFSARLDLGIDPDLYDAMVATRDELERAAPPRVLEEILRLLRGGAAHRSIYLCWETGILAVLLPELSAMLDDVEETALWARLDAVDRRQHAGRLPSDAVLLSALLYDAIDEAIGDSRDANGAFEDFAEDVGQRLAIPRRLKDRLRAVTISQRRLARGKLGTLPRRDFFADAATLFALEREARGEPAPQWALDPAVAEPEPSSDPRRRRRRRSRRRP